MEGYSPGIGNYLPRVRRDLGIDPRGNSHCALALTIQQPACGIGVSTPCGAVSTRGICVFVPGLLELKRYGRIYDPGMGNYLPRVRRDLGIGPRGNSRHFFGFMYPSQSAIRQTGGVGVSTPCGSVSTPVISLFVPGLSELHMY